MLEAISEVIYNIISRDITQELRQSSLILKELQANLNSNIIIRNCHFKHSVW